MLTRFPPMTSSPLPLPHALITWRFHTRSSACDLLADSASLSKFYSGDSHAYIINATNIRSHHALTNGAYPQDLTWAYFKRDQSLIDGTIQSPSMG